MSLKNRLNPPNNCSQTRRFGSEKEADDPPKSVDFRTPGAGTLELGSTTVLKTVEWVRRFDSPSMLGSGNYRQCASIAAPFGTRSSNLGGSLGMSDSALKKRYSSLS